MTDYTDLIARLRWDNGMDKPSALELEAADEIERLREALRVACECHTQTADQYARALGECHRQNGELEGRLAAAERKAECWEIQSEKDTARLVEYESVFGHLGMTPDELGNHFFSQGDRLAEVERDLRVFHAMIDPFDATPDEAALWEKWRNRYELTEDKA